MKTTHRPKQVLPACLIATLLLVAGSAAHEPPTHTTIEQGRLGTLMSTVIFDDSIVTLHNGGASAVTALRYDLTTNWTTIHSVALPLSVNGQWAVDDQAGQVVSNNFVMIIWKSATNRVDLESIPLHLDVLPQRTVTNPVPIKIQVQPQQQWPQNWFLNGSIITTNAALLNLDASK